MNKEEFLAYWKEKHSQVSRMKSPSEQFVEESFVQEASGHYVLKESSGKGVESSESDGLNPSTSMGSDSPPEILPEKQKKITIHDICHYCSKPLTKEHGSQFECGRGIGGSSSKSDSNYTKKETRWVSDFTKYQNSFDDDEGEIEEVEE